MKLTIMNIFVAVSLSFLFVGCNDDSAGAGDDSASHSRFRERMFKAKALAVSKMGQDIVRNIIIESACGREWLWPCLTEKDGKTSDEDEISGMTFNNSTDYFKELFDVEGLASGDHRPYVDVRLDCVTTKELPAPKEGTLEARNVAWIVCAGVGGGVNGRVPVLVSRNVDVSGFLTSGSADFSHNTTRIPLKRDVEPFGDSGAVVIYNDATAKCFTASKFTYKAVYAGSVTIPAGITLKYLEP